MTAFAQYGQTKTFPRNDHVEVHVRELTLLPGEKDARPYIDIREFLLNGEVYGNGIIIPVAMIPTLIRTLELLTKTPHHEPRRSPVPVSPGGLTGNE